MYSSMQEQVNKSLDTGFALRKPDPHSKQKHDSQGYRWVAGPAFAALSSGFVANLPANRQQGATSMVVEPSTSVVYPEEYCLRGGACTELTGLGVRTKNLLVKNLNVYTVGLYVHHPQAKSVLQRHKSKPVDKLVKDQQAYSDVITADGVMKALRLVITYGGLKKAAFLDALDQRLTGPVTKAGDGAMLKAFRGQFDDVVLCKGSVFTFFADKGGRLSTFVGDQKIGTIVSAPLVHALFDIYTGKDAVSPKTKESFGRGLHAIINT